MTKRSQILDAIELLFGGPSIVYRAPVDALYSDIDAITDYIISMTADNGETITKTRYGSYQSEMPVTIEKAEYFQFDSHTDIRTQRREQNAAAETILAALVSTALSIPDRTLGGLVQLVDLAGANIFVPATHIQAVGASIVLRVRYEFNN